MSKLSHKQLETFVTDTLCKREPCPAMVLAWGWLLKQGEGGLFHGDNFKQRFFVLARVPHATVLIYYGEKTMDEENILGYIDLRRVTAVREATRPVVIDGAKGAPGGGFLAKIGRAFTSSSASAASVAAPTRQVVELTTPGRTYVLCPQTIAMPPPMTTSAAVASTARPLYLFGWPFPVPSLESLDDSGEAAVAAAFAEGRTPPEAFAQWRDVLATAVAAEKATRQFPVVTLVDSTGQLPQRVILRTTPCELAFVSQEDKDTCFVAVPYNDLLKWELQTSGEIAISARTRARLVAKTDRSGFQSQRPTRPTCHFVIKAAQAGQVLQVMDNHLRALAKQLAGLGDGADETEALPADAVPDEDGPAAAGAGDEDSEKAASKLTGAKPTAPSSSTKEASDDEDNDAPVAVKAPAKAGSGSKASRKVAASESEEEEAPKPKAKPVKAVAKAASESEEEAPKPKTKAAKPAAKPVVASEGEEEPAPKPKAKVSKAAPVDSASEEEAPKPKAKAVKAKAVVVESEEEEVPKPKAKPVKAVAKAASESEEEAPKPKAKAAKPAAKPVVASESEEEPAPKPKAKASKAVPVESASEEEAPKPKAKAVKAVAKPAPESEEEAPKPKASKAKAAAVAADSEEEEVVKPKKKAAAKPVSDDDE